MTDNNDDRGAEVRREASLDAEAIVEALTTLDTVTSIWDSVTVVLDKVREAFGMTYAVYYQVDHECEVLRWVADSGNISPEFRKYARALTLEEGEGVSGRAWATKDYFYADSLGSVPAGIPTELVEKLDIESAIALPIIVNDVVEATVVLISNEVVPFPDLRGGALRSISREITEKLHTLSAQPDPES